VDLIQSLVTPMTYHAYA